MKGHSIMIGSASAPTSPAPQEISWKPPTSFERKRSIDPNEQEDGAAAISTKLDRNVKITPLETMMFEDGEPSSSSTIQHHQEEEVLQRADNAKSHRKPASSNKLSPFSEDVMEMNESILSMMSFSVSDLVAEEEVLVKDDATDTKNNHDKSQKSDTLNSRSLQESIQSILSDSYSQLEQQQKKEESGEEKQRVLPCNTKSCSTLTTAGSTAANSKSSISYDSHDLEGLLWERSDCSGYYGSCDGRVNRVDREPMRAPAGSCFKTPSTSRPKLRGSTTSSTKSKSKPVPKDIFSPRGVLVSPLSIDPSPGHHKLQVHQEMLKNIKLNGTTSNRSASSSSESRRSVDSASSKQQPRRQLSHVSEVNEQDTRRPRFTTKEKSPMDSFGSLDFDHELSNGFEGDNGSDDEEDFSFQLEQDSSFQVIRRGNGSSQSIGNISVASAISNSGRYLDDSCGEVSATNEPRRSTPRKNRSTGSLAKAKASVNPRTNMRIVPKKNKSAGSLAVVTRNKQASPFSLETPRPPTPVKRRQKMRSKKDMQVTRKEMMISPIIVSPKKSPRQEQNSLPQLIPPLQDERESIGTMALKDHTRSKSPHYSSSRRPSSRSKTPDKDRNRQSRDKRRSKTPDKLQLQGDKNRRRSQSRTRSKSRTRKPARSRSRGRPLEDLHRPSRPGSRRQLEI